VLELAAIDDDCDCVAACSGACGCALFAACDPESDPDICISPLSRMARPLIWADCSSATLISRLSMVPLLAVPSSTAAGWGWSAGGSEALGTGRIPRAWRAGKDATGTDTGTAADAAVRGAVTVGVWDFAVAVAVELACDDVDVDADATGAMSACEVL